MQCAIKASEGPFCVRHNLTRKVGTGKHDGPGPGHTVTGVTVAAPVTVAVGIIDHGYHGGPGVPPHRPGPGRGGRHGGCQSTTRAPAARVGRGNWSATRPVRPVLVIRPFELPPESHTDYRPKSCNSDQTFAKRRRLVTDMEPVLPVACCPALYQWRGIQVPNLRCVRTLIVNKCICDLLASLRRHPRTPLQSLAGKLSRDIVCNRVLLRAYQQMVRHSSDLLSHCTRNRVTSLYRPCPRRQARQSRSRRPKEAPIP